MPRNPGTVGTLNAEATAEAGEAALLAGDFALATTLFDRAEPGVADPDRCAGGRWMAHMLAGNFDAAWCESDAIRRRGKPDPHRFWNGEDWRGKRLILRCLHGFGDAVQMFRFLPRLRNSTLELIVEVPPRLVELAPYFESMGTVITWGRGAPAETPAWDVQIEVMELPYALRVVSDSLKPQQGYLHVPPEMQDRAAALVGTGQRPRVGLVWSAGHWNRSRSVAFSELRRLLQVEGIEFWSLQGEPERTAWVTMNDLGAHRDVYECGDGILPLAAVIERLDLVITVDTLAAHLAGALGVPCWVLLQRQADWRWTCGRTDSPWYPSLRLWRQSTQGNWADLLEEIRAELHCWSTRRYTNYDTECLSGLLA